VLIAIEYPEAGYAETGVVRPLGGRLISDSSSGNFVTRGLGEHVFDGKDGDYLLDSYVAEVYTHSQLAIPVNKKFKLRFYLENYNGKRIGWVGDKVRIYTPVYKAVHETIRCSSYAYSTEDPRVRAACLNDEFHGALDLSTKQPDFSAPHPKFVDDLGCADVQPEVAAPYYAAATETNPVCRDIHHQQECPGGATLTQPACSSKHLPDAALQEICPAPAGAQNVSWDIAATSQARTTSICTYDSDQDALVCDGGSIIRRSGNDRKNDEGAGICPLGLFNKQPLGTSVVQDRVCGFPQLKDIEADFNRKAQQLIPAGVPVTRNVISREYEYHSHVPEDPCLRYIKGEDLKEKPQEYVLGHWVTKDVADSMCKKFAGSCRRVPVSPERYFVEAYEQQVRLGEAQRVGLVAMTTAWPAMRQSCLTGVGSDGCGDVSFSVSPSGQVNGEAQTKISLKLLKLVPGSSEISLSYSASRMAESAIGRQLTGVANNEG